MLALSPLRNFDNRESEMDRFPIGKDDFSGEDFLDEIDFGELFVGINCEDALLDLEMDSETLAEFSTTETDIKGCTEEVDNEKKESQKREEEDDKDLIQSDEITSQGSSTVSTSEKTRKSTSQTKSTMPNLISAASQGKRKGKVDWTPELHRRFVQAVEQLGMDKAVPSRILEIMGIDSLTRHNIASHLQKYRSHRKHLMAREAEAASMNQRRQLYSRCGSRSKRDMGPWLPPAMGIPQSPSPMQTFRPLHVWGHPTSAISNAVNPWPPKHLVQPSMAQPPLPWTTAPIPTSPPDNPYWHPHGRVHALVPGAPCLLPQPHTPARYTLPSVPSIPPPPQPAPAQQTTYKRENGVPLNITTPDSPDLDFELRPSKETIDDAIGDVLEKPWLPLPLGLKPPSLESVTMELQRQGISNIPSTW